MKDAGVSLSLEKKETEQQSLAGLEFVITGKLASIPRPQAEEKSGSLAVRQKSM